MGKNYRGVESILGQPVPQPRPFLKSALTEAIRADEMRRLWVEKQMAAASYERISQTNQWVIITPDFRCMISDYEVMNVPSIISTQNAVRELLKGHLEERARIMTEGELLFDLAEGPEQGAGRPIRACGAVWPHSSVYVGRQSIAIAALALAYSKDVEVDVHGNAILKIPAGYLNDMDTCLDRKAVRLEVAEMSDGTVELRLTAMNAQVVDKKPPKPKVRKRQRSQASKEIFGDKGD